MAFLSRGKIEVTPAPVLANIGISSSFDTESKKTEIKKEGRQKLSLVSRLANASSEVEPNPKTAIALNHV
jgi:hypothetical protein